MKRNRSKSGGSGERRRKNGSSERDSSKSESEEEEEELPFESVSRKGYVPPSKRARKVHTPLRPKGDEDEDGGGGAAEGGGGKKKGDAMGGGSEIVKRPVKDGDEVAKTKGASFEVKGAPLTPPTPRPPPTPVPKVPAVEEERPEVEKSDPGERREESQEAEVVRIFFSFFLHSTTHRHINHQILFRQDRGQRKFQCRKRWKRGEKRPSHRTGEWGSFGTRPKRASLWPRWKRNPPLRNRLPPSRQGLPRLAKQRSPQQLRTWSRLTKNLLSRHHPLPSNLRLKNKEKDFHPLRSQFRRRSARPPSGGCRSLKRLLTRGGGRNRVLSKKERRERLVPTTTTTKAERTF